MKNEKRMCHPGPSVVPEAVLAAFCIFAYARRHFYILKGISTMQNLAKNDPPLFALLPLYRFWSRRKLTRAFGGSYERYMLYYAHVLII